MATRVFTDAELERLRSFPEINPDELIRFFTLTKADVEFVDPGRGRGPADRLGMAVQLCTLPWLGFVPDEVAAAPPARARCCTWRSACSSRPWRRPLVKAALIGSWVCAVSALVLMAGEAIHIGHGTWDTWLGVVGEL